MVALILPAMYGGLDIEAFLGGVTDELVDSIAREYQSIVRVTNAVSPVGIHAAVPLAPASRASGVAAGYSAGIDSFACLADQHFRPDIPSSHRLTHLLFNNVGSHSQRSEFGRGIWGAKTELMCTGAATIGLPLKNIDSNMSDFYVHVCAGRDVFQQTHTPRNASVAHLLSGGIGRWFYASAVSVWQSHADHIYATGYSDPFTLPLLSTSGLTLSQHGQTMMRVQKTILVAELPQAWENLDVCVNSSPERTDNCSYCDKCMRTALTLELLGELEKFSGRFDLGVYRQRREGYLMSLLAQKNDFLSREILDLMHERGVRLPTRAYAVQAKRVARRVGHHGKRQFAALLRWNRQSGLRRSTEVAAGDGAESS